MAAKNLGQHSSDKTILEKAAGGNEINGTAGAIASIDDEVAKEHGQDHYDDSLEHRVILSVVLDGVTQSNILPITHISLSSRR
jgi:hypothetical protein